MPQLSQPWNQAGDLPGCHLRQSVQSGAFKKPGRQGMPEAPTHAQFQAASEPSALPAAGPRPAAAVPGSDAGGRPRVHQVPQQRSQKTVHSTMHAAPRALT